MTVKISSETTTDQFSTITDALTTRECVCGVWFTPTTPRQKFCSRVCSHKGTNNRRRDSDRAIHKVRFIGVDGEGINLSTGEHHYVMLSVGDETLWKGGRPLTHHDIFPFLWEQFIANPKAIFVGFFLSYDFTMWLKSLTEHEGRMLFTPDGIAARKPKSKVRNPAPFPVYVGDEWQVDILGMKRFKIRPNPLPGEKAGPWLYINDTGAFWQTSFLRAIDPAEWHGNAPCTADEYAILTEGKGKRADVYEPGDVSYLADMVRYNQLENDILARALTILDQGFVSAGIRLSRSTYYGPGQAVQGWLNGLKQPCLTHEDIEAVTPDWVLDSFRQAYYGGRFELFVHGHVPGDTFEYDITSAYPFAMIGLPCLCSGKWTRGTGDNMSLSGLTLVYGTFAATQNRIGPLPFRNKIGNILYPNETSGWYLASEIRSAYAAGLLEILELRETITFESGCNHPPPLASLGELFLQRLRVGKATPHGKALKLVYNSAYGKFAQSIGAPKFGNPIYAAMITSHTRSLILDAIGSHPNAADDLIMIATDGIYFRSPNPALDNLLDSRLGGWERSVKHNLTVMKPGVYWDDKSRAAVRDGGLPAIKSRGIAARTLADNIARLDQEFRLSDEPPSLQVSIPFSIISPRLALARGKWHRTGVVEYEQSRQETASIAPKRRNPFRDGDLLRSELMRVPAGMESTPYARRFGFDPIERELDAESWGITPDGNASEVFADAIRSLTNL